MKKDGSWGRLLKSDLDGKNGHTKEHCLPREVTLAPRRKLRSGAMPGGEVGGALEKTRGAMWW